MHVEWLDHHRALADEEQVPVVEARAAHIGAASVGHQHRRRRLIFRLLVYRSGEDAANRTAAEIQEVPPIRQERGKAREPAFERRQERCGTAGLGDATDTTGAAAAKDNDALAAPGAGADRPRDFAQRLRRSAFDSDLLELIAKAERDVPAVRRPEDTLRCVRTRQHPGFRAVEIADPDAHDAVRTDSGKRQLPAVRRQRYVGPECRARRRRDLETEWLWRHRRCRPARPDECAHRSEERHDCRALPQPQRPRGRLRSPGRSRPPGSSVIRSSACLISRADCHRLSGSFSRQVCTTRSRPFGVSGRSSLIGRGWSLRIDAITLAGLPPSKTRFPVMSS